MPVYAYKCNKCDNIFELFIKSRAQADCNKTIPNSKRAICNKCNIIADRTYEGTKLYSLIGACYDRMLRMLKPTPDPAFGGRMSVDAGRNYGHCITLDDSNIPRIDDESPRYIFDFRIGCDCAFCKPYITLEQCKDHSNPCECGGYDNYEHSDSYNKKESVSFYDKLISGIDDKIDGKSTPCLVDLTCTTYDCNSCTKKEE